jgi:hypothetical protein
MVCLTTLFMIETPDLWDIFGEPYGRNLVLILVLAQHITDRLMGKQKW